MRQVRRDFEADIAIVSVGLLIDRAEYIGHCLNICDDQCLVDLVCTLALSDELVDLLIIGMTRADRLIKNGGVCCDSNYAVLLQHTLKLARGKLRTVDVIVPDALA